MKICLVVCLALAHLAAGSIFQRKQSRPMQGLNIQPLEYMDPATYNLMQKQARSFQQQQVRYQPLEAREYQSQLVGDFQPQEVRDYLPQQARYQKPIKTVYVNRDADSSSQSSEEARQILVNIPTYTKASAEWNVPQYVAKNKQVKINKPMYSDPASWRGIQMATGSKYPISDKDIEMIFKDSFDTVKDFTEEEKKAYHESYMAAATNEDIHLNATTLLQKYQYPVEEHTVKTDDGYILTLFRIPPKQKARDVQKRPVVFLMHGLLGSADDWLLMGPGKSLAYLLADADYDVWMGNARGNKYSRRHVIKHPALNDFWQFSNDEIALHDLPAMIDYALKTSNQEKMYYVGYSEGTTAFFALAASRREYNDKIVMMYALAPMVYMSHTRSPLMRMIAPNSPFYERLHHSLGHGEFKPTTELVQTIGGDMLAKKSGCKHVASNVNFVMAGLVDNYDPQIVPMIESHLPAGASTRQIKQYGQTVATGEFRKYDFGPYINLQVYGSEQPPKYEMSAVQTPVTLYYAAEDWLSTPEDVQRLRTELPRLTEAYAVPAPHFAHLDFQFSKSAPDAVYQRLIASIQNTQ